MTNVTQMPANAETDQSAKFDADYIAPAVLACVNAYGAFDGARSNLRLAMVALMVAEIAVHNTDGKGASKAMIDRFPHSKTGTLSNYRSQIRGALDNKACAEIRAVFGEVSLLSVADFAKLLAKHAASFNASMQWDKAKAEPAKAETTKDETTKDETTPAQPAALSVDDALTLLAKAWPVLSAAIMAEPGGVAHTALQSFRDQSAKLVADADATIAKRVAADQKAAERKAKAAAKRAALRAA